MADIESKMQNKGYQYLISKFGKAKISSRFEYINNLLIAIFNGEKISRKKLNYYTKSLLPYVAKAYGL